MPSFLNSPQPLEVALSPLAGFSDEQFAIFQKATSGDRRFLLSSAAISDLGLELAIDQDALSLLLSALAFLQENLQEKASTSEFEAKKRGISDFLVTSHKIVNDEDIKRIVSRLNNILVFSERFPFFLKNTKLTKGFLPNVSSFSTFVDLRANFVGAADVSSPSDVGGFVTVIQCRIKLESENDSTETIFQISEDNIEEFISALARAKQKSAALRELIAKVSVVF